MATVTKICATPYMLRLSAVGPSEGGDTATILQSELIEFCDDGPLKNLFTSPFFQPAPGQGPNPNEWTSMQTDARLTTRLTGFGVSSAAQPFSHQWGASEGNFLTITFVDGGTVLVELRYENTLVR